MALLEDLAIKMGEVESVPVLLHYVALRSRQGMVARNHSLRVAKMQQLQR